MRPAFLVIGVLCLAPTATDPAVAAPADPASRSWVSLLRGEWPAAERSARLALDERPDDARAAACLAEAVLRQHRDPEPEILAMLRASPAIEDVARGTISFLRRDFDDAIARLGRAHDRLQEAGDAAGRLVALQGLATALQDGNRWKEALDAHVRTIDLADSLGDPLPAVAARYGLAYCRIALGAPDDARQPVERSLREARELDLPLWIGHASAFVAVLDGYALDLESAAAGYENAAAAYARAGRPDRQASALRRLGGTVLSRGDYPGGIASFRRARELALAAGDVREAAFCLEHLGSASRDLGHLDLAVSEWRDALETGADSWPAEWKSGTLLNIGSIELERGNPAAARETFERARRVLAESESELTLPSVLTAIGRCHRVEGDPGKAIASLGQAAELAERLGLPGSVAAARVETGAAELARGDSDAARREFTAAARTIDGRGFPDLEIASLVGLAEVARTVGRPDSALTRLEEAIAIAERVRRRSRGASTLQQEAFGRAAHLWEAALEVLHERHLEQPSAGFDRRAFEVVQRAKARSFADLLAEWDLDLRFRADEDYRRREREIHAELDRLDASRHAAGPSKDAGSSKGAGRSKDAESSKAGLAASRRRLEEDLAILESEIRSREPRYAEIRYPQPRTIDEVRGDVSGPGHALLEYFLGREASYLWVVTAGDFRFVRLPPRPEIERAVRSLLRLLRDYNLLGPDPAYYEPEASNLSDALLGALDFSAIDRLTIAPDGILHYLPFEALLVPGADRVARGEGRRSDGTEQRSFADLAFLVQSAVVTYTPSLGLPGRSQGAASFPVPTGELLLVGDPVPGAAGPSVYLRESGGSVGLGRAPFAGTELESLGAMFRGRPVEVLRGESAMREALRAEGNRARYRLVHFAAHGVFRESRPRFSGLVLSPTAADDGFLSLGDVFALRLSCDQVVLSACSSALGERVTGEGLVGLTRAFVFAGARSVVSSLWEVSGEATSQLMSELYGRIRDENRDRAVALAEAKRAMIRAGAAPGQAGTAEGEVAGPGLDLAHPYCWAAFVLNGDGGAR